MVSIVRPKSSNSDGGEPPWDIALLFPAQGDWEDVDYLSLDTNRLVEFADGSIEVLPTPTPAHQRIVLYLCDELRGFIRQDKRGEVLIAPMRIRLRPGKFREPDVMFMLAEHSASKGEEYWDGADLVMEVVSGDPESHQRDHGRKRSDYAQAGIPEYWIVDPHEKHIIVLTLNRGDYRIHSEANPEQYAASLLLPGFSIRADDVFAAADAG